MNKRISKAHAVIAILASLTSCCLTMEQEIRTYGRTGSTRQGIYGCCLPVKRPNRKMNLLILPFCQTVQVPCRFLVSTVKVRSLYACVSIRAVATFHCGIGDDGNPTTVSTMGDAFQGKRETVPIQDTDPKLPISFGCFPISVLCHKIVGDTPAVRGDLSLSLWYSVG